MRGKPEAKLCTRATQRVGTRRAEGLIAHDALEGQLEWAATSQRPMGTQTHAKIGLIEAAALDSSTAAAARQYASERNPTQC
jgi:hypothetical protein